MGEEFLASFSPGETRASFRIPIIDDDFSEPDETFSLTLEIPQEAQNVGVMRGVPFMATVTITHDDRECSAIA